VTLADRTRVDGTIHGKVTITSGNGVFIKAKDAKTFPVTTTNSSITFPLPIPGGVNLEPGVTAGIGPGAFGAVVVKANAVLNMAAGSYLMDSLDLEPSGKLALDTSKGPVRIYIRGAAILRGNIASPTGAKDLSIVYFGSAALQIEAPLTATVISAAATINVKSVQTLSGAYFAPSVEVFPDDTVTHVASQTPVIAKRTGRVEAESFDAKSGGHNAGATIDQLSGGNWLLYRGFDFGAAGQYNRIQLNVLSPTGVDEIVVRVDSLTGTVAGDLQTLQTGPGYIVESTALNPAVTGVHDTYVIFNGAEAGGLDWFELGKAPTGQVLTQSIVKEFPDGGPPPPAPVEDEEDFPDNTFWTQLPHDVQMPPHTKSGKRLQLGVKADVLLQVTWTGGPGPVGIDLYDESVHLIPPSYSRSFPGENKLLVVMKGVSPQLLALIIRNDGDTMVTTNAVNGFAPVP
jgi:hypothetical protein